MSLSNKLGGLLVGYIAYQIITNNKYDFLRDDVRSLVFNNKQQLLDIIEALDLYISTPSSVGSETNRIRIEQEIEKIKQRISEFNAKEMAVEINDKTTILNEIVSKTSAKVKK